MEEFGNFLTNKSGRKWSDVTFLSLADNVNRKVEYFLFQNQNC